MVNADAPWVEFAVKSIYSDRYVTVAVYSDNTVSFEDQDGLVISLPGLLAGINRAVEELK